MKSVPAPVTIIILTWNGLEYTKRCLDTLGSNTDHPAYHVVVVDNGSTDGTGEYLQTLGWLSVIRNNSNLGFARANNLAIQEVAPDRDIVLLNNDIEIHQSDWLARMQTAAYGAADIGVVGCRLVRPEGMLQHAGAYMPLETFWGQQIGGGENDINQYNDDREVESVVFACVYLKREVLERVGLLDEDYFCYFEDTDYCFRALACGYRTLCCGGVTLVHHENVSTKVNGTTHSSLFRKGQQTFRARWEKKLRRDRYNREIGWHSILNFPTGYAISSRAMVTALDRQGVYVSYRYLCGPGTGFPHREPEDSGSHIIDLIRSRKLTPGVPQVVYGWGDMLHANFGAYRVGYTMLETDRIPGDWVRQANAMDEIWSPSAFNAETFRASGIEKPIYVIPLGVDPDYFNPRISRSPLAGVYTFLSVFEWGERKAPELLLRAFNEEFRAEEPAILLAKVINVDPDLDVQREVANLGLSSSGGRIHLSLNQLVPAYQLGVLYRSADCLVLTTRGEGWAMPVIEAMACGIPVIATNWGAHCDYMTMENAYPLRIERLVPARAKCPYYTGFRWAEPSYSDLRRLLRHVYENQAEARSKGELASKEVRENWTWDHAARKIIARLDSIHHASAEKDIGVNPRPLVLESTGGATASNPWWRRSMAPNTTGS
jgi:GT2 family glycosyltransferase